MNLRQLLDKIRQFFTLTMNENLTLRQRMGTQIVKEEGRYKNGKLQIYKLPSGDGGGTYEVAGINDRYDPKALAQLVELIRAGHEDQAELMAADYILDQTDVARSWLLPAEDPGVEFYLRDSVFNRGAHGAAVILQMALGIKHDGDVGPITKKAIADALRDPEKLLEALRASREEYERVVVHRDESSKFWNGLVNRWNNALQFSRSLEAHS